jgi:DNA-binding ferritin-like protein
MSPSKTSNITTIVVKSLFELQMIVKLFHWKTISFSLHKASDELYSSLIDLGDELVETMIIRYGRPESIPSIKCNTYEPEEIKDYLNKCATNFWTLEFNKIISKKDSDLQSIRDDILAAINKALYLMSLE